MFINVIIVKRIVSIAFFVHKKNVLLRQQNFGQQVKFCTYDKCCCSSN